MRKLVVQVSEYMCMSAAQKGVTVEVERLYGPVGRYLQEVESVLARETVESFSPRHWAILFSHARANNIAPRDVVMQLLSNGMENSAKTVMQMSSARDAKASRQARKPALRLVK